MTRSHGGNRVLRDVIRNGFNNRPKKRFFGWTPPTDWWSGDTISWRDLGLTATGGSRDLTFHPAAPVAGDAEGGPVRLTLTVPDLGDLKGTSEAVNVRVTRRDRGDLTWREVWQVGETMRAGGGNLRVTNIHVSKPTYQVDKPKDGLFTTAGDAVQVTVKALRDDRYKALEKSGTVKVVADMKALAGDTARGAMKNGNAWGGPDSKAGQELLDDYNNDEDGVRTKATKIMSDIKDMKKGQLTGYMNRLGLPSTRSGRPANIIWEVAPGLQVRYKPQGDDRRGPCFCIEGKTSNGFSFNQDSCAFKLMPDGEPGPKGCADTLLPQWVLDSPGDVYDAYMDAACDMTHIACKT